MSAWVLPDEHINVIVSYFTKRNTFDGLWLELEGQYQYLNKDTAPKLAQILYAENIRSINSRYNEETSNEYMGYEYIPQARDVYSVPEIAQALSSYDYQSCETEDYHESEAAKIINLMRKQLLNELVDAEEGIDTWRIDTVKTDGVHRVG